MKRSIKALTPAELLELFASPEADWPRAEKILLEQGAAAGRLAFELSGVANNYNAFAASFLAKAAKKAAIRDELESILLDSREPLHIRLRDSSPKRRKQAARLIGALANPLDTQALLTALQNEQQRFVRPSIILALGTIDSSEARAALSGYSVEPPSSESDEKHANEERLALSSALTRLSPAAIPAFTGFTGETRVVLRGAIPSSILYEGAQNGIQMLDPHATAPGLAPPRITHNNFVHSKSDGVHLICSDFALLQRIRSYQEALVPLGNSAFDPHALKALLTNEHVREKLSGWFESVAAFPLRLEVRGVPHEKRLSFIKESVPLLEALGFSNAPGAYAAELRVEVADNKAALYIKPSMPDERFAYRQNALPASIHPADAAAIIRCAFPDKPARVLDPCCGSGTLLIEYGLFAKARLFGVDISPKAIEAAKANASAAKLKIQFVRKDLKDFIAGEPFDAVVSNLPFGLRVGTHSDNKLLYANLLDSLKRSLKPGGVAALYTADYKLLLGELRKRPWLSVSKEVPLSIGGLHARLVVIKVG